MSHELFGMDVLVDEMLRPWLLEFNISPSLHSATAIDVAVKAPLASDVMNMCGLVFPPAAVEFDSSALHYRVRNCPRNKSLEHLRKEVDHLNHFIAMNVSGDSFKEEIFWVSYAIR